MRPNCLAVVAGVEWHAGSRGMEHPIAITLGRLRLPVEVERAWTEGPETAGRAEFRVYIVRDAEGRSFRIRAGERAVLVEVSRAR